MNDTQQWLEARSAGDPVAQQRFNGMYAARIAEQARRVLQGLPPVVSGTDIAQSVMRQFFDWVSSPPHLDDLQNRSQLDALLYKMTLNRAINEKKRLLAQRRHPVLVVSDEDLIASGAFQEQFPEKHASTLAGLVFVEQVPIDGAVGRTEMPEDGARRLLDRISTWLVGHRKSPGKIMSMSENVDCVHETSLVKDMVTGPGDPLIAAMVQEAIADLDDQSRQIVLMRFVGEYTLAEISKKVGLSVPTVRHRLEDTLAGWRRYLNDTAEGPSPE